MMGSHMPQILFFRLAVENNVYVMKIMNFLCLRTFSVAVVFQQPMAFSELYFVHLANKIAFKFFFLPFVSNIFNTDNYSAHSTFTLEI